MYTSRVISCVKSTLYPGRSLHMSVRLYVCPLSSRPIEVVSIDFLNKYFIYNVQTQYITSWCKRTLLISIYVAQIEREGRNITQERGEGERGQQNR